MVAAGVLGMVAAVLFGTDHDPAAVAAVSVAAGVMVLAALATYPAARWRHSADFLALVMLIGCGLVTVVYRTADVAGLMGLVQGCVLIVYVWWRIEVSAGRERRALIWMALFTTTTLLAFGLVSFATVKLARGSRA